MTPVTVYYNLKAGFTPSGSYLQVSQGVVGSNGQPPTASPGCLVRQGFPIPAPCRQAFASFGPKGVPGCLAAHGHRGYLTYQSASGFWAFQGIEVGIYLVLAAALLGVTFWVITRWDGQCRRDHRSDYQLVDPSRRGPARAGRRLNHEIQAVTGLFTVAYRACSSAWAMTRSSTRHISLMINSYSSMRNAGSTPRSAP